MTNLDKKIFIIGGYGFGNLGDEAVLDVIINRLKRKKRQPKITVLSHDPEETRRFHGVDACTPLTSVFEILRSDEVVVGGGEVITYHKKPWFAYLVTCISLIAIIKVFQKRKQLTFSDIGVRPITSIFPKVILSKLMCYANSISVRDISQKEFEALGVKKEFKVVPDPALELEPVDSKIARKYLQQQGVATNKLLVGFSVATVKSEEFNQKIAEVIPQIIDWLSTNPHVEVVFISTSNHKYRNREKDLIVAEKLNQKINCKGSFKILRGNYSPREIEAIIGQMNLFVVMRLHPLILAHNMKVPSICIAYYARVRSFCKLYDKNKIDIEEINFHNLKDKILVSFEKYIKKDQAELLNQCVT